MKKKILFLAFGCLSIMTFTDIHMTWTTSCGTKGHKDFAEGTTKATIENYIKQDNMLKCGVKANVTIIIMDSSTK